MALGAFLMAKHSGWRNPPPVSFVGGDEEYLCRRVLNLAVKTAAEVGRRVEFVSSQDEILDTMSSAVLFDEPTLLIVRDFETLDVEWVKGHKNNTVAVVLYCPQEVKTKALKDLVEAVPKPYRFIHHKPAPYKAAEKAAEFVVEEAKRLGKEMPAQLATALVGRVGSDFGLLSYEVLKVSLLLDARGEGPVITPAHVGQTMLLSGEADIGAVVDAVGAGSVVKTLRTLEAVKNNWHQAGEPTLAVVAWLGNRATSWLHAVALDAQGADEKEAAHRTGINPYIYSRSTLPTARRWGKARLVVLLRRLAQVEMAVKQGRQAPWTMLECSLIASVRSVESAR